MPLTSVIGSLAPLIVVRFRLLPLFHRWACWAYPKLSEGMGFISPLCDLISADGVARGNFPMPRLDRLVVRGAPGLPNCQRFFSLPGCVVLLDSTLQSTRGRCCWSILSVCSSLIVAFWPKTLLKVKLQTEGWVHTLDALFTNSFRPKTLLEVELQTEGWVHTLIVLGVSMPFGPKNSGEDLASSRGRTPGGVIEVIWFLLHFPSFPGTPEAPEGCPCSTLL